MWYNYDGDIMNKNKSGVISFKVSQKTQDMMTDELSWCMRETTPQYAKWQAKDGDTVVTLYESGKVVFQGKDADLASDFWITTEKINSGNVEVKNSANKEKKEKDTVITLYESGKCMFQGTSADVDAAMWGVALENTKEKQEENKKKDAKYYTCNSVGSDEVGTGDYFGPIVVTAAYVSEDKIKFLEEIGVKDSKKLTDLHILDIVPKFIKEIEYESIILSNKEYNESHSKNINMNKIKAILHNKVLYKMTNKINNYDFVIVDQFAEPYVYYNYLKGTPNIVRNITFFTKGEDKHLSVACASLISRYIFINEFNKLSKSLDINLPKGAGDIVDTIGKQIVEKYGFDKLNEIAKLNFKNTEKIKGN